MAGCWIIVVLAAGVVDRICSIIDILSGRDLFAVVATFDFAVKCGKDTAIGRLVEALAINEKGLGVGCEARTRVVDDFVKGMAWRCQGAEFLLTGSLADPFVRLNEVEINLLGD